MINFERRGIWKAWKANGASEILESYKDTEDG